MGLNLPMMAFRLNGYGEYIQLTIDEVYGYSGETSYGGGYGAKGNIQISVGGYKVDSQHYFTTGELFMFKQELAVCYEMLTGFATLPNVDRELDLSVLFNKTGKVVINGWFQEHPGIENILTFHIESDQTNILPVIKQLDSVQKVFGDMKGIKK